jgi:hypothetical protein
MTCVLMLNNMLIPSSVVFNDVAVINLNNILYLFVFVLSLIKYILHVQDLKLYP